MKQDGFDKLVIALKRKNISCRVKKVDDSIVVELGWNYPDSLADKVDKASEQTGTTVDNICAEIHGGFVSRSVNVNGGPRRY